MRPASFAACSMLAPCHQGLDALVHIAEPLLEPHHRLAIGGEAEMSRLDDAGMHGADRDLVQPLALGRQEGIGGRRGRRAPMRSQRMPHAPAPWSSQGRVSGSPTGFKPIEVADAPARAGSPADAACPPTG